MVPTWPITPGLIAISEIQDGALQLSSSGMPRYLAKRVASRRASTVPSALKPSPKRAALRQHRNFQCIWKARVLALAGLFFNF